MNRVVFIAALAILTIGAALWTGEAADQQEKADMDITFVIAGELAERGGLVQIALLQKEDADALTEPFEVPLNSVASVVLVTIPVGASYTYRFRRLDDVNKGQTKRFSVGTYGPGTTVDGTYLDMGGDWTLESKPSPLCGGGGFCSAGLLSLPDRGGGDHMRNVRRVAPRSAEMTRLILHLRLFHPLSNFGPSGLGYHGDDRDFSTDVGTTTTSRIYLQKTFDLATATAQPALVNSAPSSHFLGMHQDYSQKNTQPTKPVDSAQIDAYRPDGDQGLQCTVAYTGQNFAMPFVQEGKGFYDAVVPGLDVTCSLHAEIDRDDKKMSFTFRMVGDGFPNSEAFILDDGNKPLMLATHRRIGSALHQLRGNRRIAMASSSAVVDFDAGLFGEGIDVNWCLDYATVTGSQIDVMEETGKKPTTVSDWNTMHTGREAKGGGPAAQLGYRTHLRPRSPWEFNAMTPETNEHRRASPKAR